MIVDIWGEKQVVPSVYIVRRIEVIYNNQKKKRKEKKRKEKKRKEKKRKEKKRKEKE